ncbi:hypothetical protein R83H12_00435 [Fibrobacteria bacterium R8-3-H12]
MGFFSHRQKLSSLGELLFNENISVIASPKILEEVIEASSRKKVKKYARQENIARVLNLIESLCVDDPDGNAAAPELRDPDDLYLLALSDIVGADFLLTGDKDLLSLGKYNKTEIISYNGFIAKLKEFF